MDDMVVEATERVAQGTGAARRLRSEGWLPGNVYSEGKPARLIKFREHAFSKALRSHHSENFIVSLALDSEQPKKMLMREIQHNPVSGAILHVDFYEVDMSKKIKVEVPIQLEGTPVGVSQSGGVVELLLHAVEIECLPTDLVEEFIVDISELDVNDSLDIKDLKVNREKYTFSLEEDIAIVSVAPPRVDEDKDEEGDKAGEGESKAEPEVIGEKKEDEESGGDS